ncbi:MAG: 7-cyano-7-deazaguanine synthase QueC [Acidobacteriota bacterium]
MAVTGRDGRQRPLAVVLLSGGMDSAVAAATAARTYRLACLHATYRQRTANRERVCFGALAHHFEATHRLVIDLGYLARIGGSALTDPGIPVPDASPASETIPVTYVPFRNANLLAAAVSWAEALGAEAVIIGAVEEDSSGYPDCRQAFCDAFARAVDEGTRPTTHVRLLTPVIHASKAEIVRSGVALGLPFHLTWSCYRSESVPCRRCDSCRLRREGFAGAGVDDPLDHGVVPPAVEGSLDQGVAPSPMEGAASRSRAIIDRLKGFLATVGPSRGRS